MSIAKISQVGAANQPSPSIWRDCRMSLLNDLGLGKYAAYNGMGSGTGVQASTGMRPSVGDFEVTADDDTVFSNILIAAEEGGRIDIETDGDDNDAWQVHTGIGIGLVINSGNKVWFEARVALGAAADQGFFVGLVEEAAISDPIQDNGLLSAAQSVFGFFTKSDDTGAIDALFTLDAGAAVNVVADVTNSTAFTDAGGTAKDFPVADAFTKFGLRFDGRDQLEYYVDGYKVASVTLASGTHATGVAMAPMIALKTGTAAARSGNISFARFAFQERT